MGETNNMARRHGWEYRAHGDHLAPFFEAALNDGSTVWRRVRYTVSCSPGRLAAGWPPDCRLLHCSKLSRTCECMQTMTVMAGWTTLPFLGRPTASSDVETVLCRSRDRKGSRNVLHVLL